MFLKVWVFWDFSWWFLSTSDSKSTTVPCVPPIVWREENVKFVVIFVLIMQNENHVKACKFCRSIRNQKSLKGLSRVSNFEIKLRLWDWFSILDSKFKISQYFWASKICQIRRKCRYFDNLSGLDFTISNFWKTSKTSRFGFEINQKGFLRNFTKS